AERSAVSGTTQRLSGAGAHLCTQRRKVIAALTINQATPDHGVPPTMSEYSVFTSESVSEGHPDKMADQVSDAVLDAIIAQDPHARVAVETMVKTGMAIIAGEVTTNCYV